jgi:hypothetical protein
VYLYQLIEHMCIKLVSARTFSECDGERSEYLYQLIEHMCIILVSARTFSECDGERSEYLYQLIGHRCIMLVSARTFAECDGEWSVPLSADRTHMLHTSTSTFASSGVILISSTRV